MQRNDWQQRRRGFITGTGASAIMGCNPYMSNVEYWERLTGRKKAPDISGKEFVQYGLNAEPFLIELFRLDYPQYEVLHKDYDLRKHPEYDFLIGSIDGQLIEKETGKNGILEIKTAEVMSRAGMEKWIDGMPQNYFYQVIHYLLVTGYDFAVVKAQLKHVFKNDMWLETKHYEFTRQSVQQVIDDLLQKELEFWDSVINDKRPSLLLPRI